MVVVVDPEGRSRFFVGAVMGPVSQPRFFVEAAVRLVIGEAVGLAIGEAVLTEADITIGFFGLSLW